MGITAEGTRDGATIEGKVGNCRQEEEAEEAREGRVSYRGIGERKLQKEEEGGDNYGGRSRWA